MSYEGPRYAVLHREGAIEYRHYEPALIAETVIEASQGYDAAGNEVSVEVDQLPGERH